MKTIRTNKGKFQRLFNFRAPYPNSVISNATI